MGMTMRHFGFGLAILTLAACAYPRNATTMHAVGPVGLQAEGPEHLWAVQVVDAEIPARKAMGLPWDEDGTPPDVFLRIWVDDRMIWESETRHDTLRPQWNAVLPRNLEIRPEQRLRLELWDRDTGVAADAIGQYAHTGLPANALPGSRTRLALSNGASVTIIWSEPHAYRGVGIRTYELRHDDLRVVEIEGNSPASRAGIRPGDRITAIGGRTVGALGAKEAASQLSLAVERSLELEVTDPRDQPRKVVLDGGYIWLTM
jgi:hypothetical protein